MSVFVSFNESFTILHGVSAETVENKRRMSQQFLRDVSSKAFLLNPQLVLQPVIFMNNYMRYCWKLDSFRGYFSFIDYIRRKLWPTAVTPSITVHCCSVLLACDLLRQNILSCLLFRVWRDFEKTRFCQRYRKKSVCPRNHSIVVFEKSMVRLFSKKFISFHKVCNSPSTYFKVC